MNNECAVCPNAPACKQCNGTNPEQCLVCYTGYYLKGNTCQACPGYCASCTSSGWCQRLETFIGNVYALMPLSATVNVPTICDPGCGYCSHSNSEMCISCIDGYYMMNAYCLPCAASSFCASCSKTNSAICLSCFAGFYLNSSSICVMCTFPCTACINQKATMCSACAVGYVYSSSNNTCIDATSTTFSNFGTDLENCINSELSIATGGG